MINAFMLRDTESKHLYLRIYEYYKEEILSGAMEKGQKLPSIRALAKALHVSKITVESAYSQLLAEGYIENRPRKGYFAVDLFGYEFKRATIQEEKEEEEVGAINTGVDQASLDMGLWKRMYAMGLREHGSTLHESGSLRGELLLRQQIQEFIAKSRGVVCSPSQIVIGSGIQYLLGILCGLVRDSRLDVVVEDPGFEQAKNTFEDHGFRIHPVTLDTEGIRMAPLEELRRCLAYLSPSHQYPTGSVMSIKRRLEVLQWARTNDTLLIEDDYDSIFRYETEPIPSLQGLDEGNHVVYLGSFSKLLTPSIRISYMVLTKDLLGKYESKIHRFTQTASRLEQLALGYYMREGHFERHLRRANKMYQKKSLLLQELLQKKFGPDIQIIGGSSGLHLMLRLKGKKTLEEMERICSEHLVYMEAVGMEEGGKEYVLLPYSGLTMEQIEDIFG